MLYFYSIRFWCCCASCRWMVRPAKCTKIIGRISTIATWFASQQPHVCIPFNTIRNHPATRGGDFRHWPGNSTHARGMRESLFQRQTWAEISGKAAASDVGSAKWGAGIPRVGFWCGQPEADLPWSVDWGHMWSMDPADVLPQFPLHSLWSWLALQW